MSSAPASFVSASPKPLSPAPRAVVHKFGGTSVADAACYRHVAQLLLARPESRQVTVVSAMKGVTDALIQMAGDAGGGNDWRELWHDTRARHRGAAVALLGEHAGPLLEWLDRQFDQLGEILAALAVIGELPREVLDRVQGLGEVYSAQLLGEHLRALGQPCAVLDAREVLVVNRGELGVDVDWGSSAERLAQWRASNAQLRVVVTGFIARDRAGPYHHAGPQWQRLFRRDLRRAVRGRRAAHLDRCRWRALG